MSMAHDLIKRHARKRNRSFSWLPMATDWLHVDPDKQG